MTAFRGEPSRRPRSTAGGRAEAWTCTVSSMQFTSCHPGAFAAASAEAGTAGAAPGPRSARREVVVGGRRVKTIDIHAHCVVEEAQALLGIPTRDIRFGRGIDEVGAQRLRVMDEQGIDLEALSIKQTLYRAGCDLDEYI